MEIVIPVIPLCVVLPVVVETVYKVLFSPVERLQGCDLAKPETNCEDVKPRVAKKNPDNFDSHRSGESRADVDGGDVGVVMERLGIDDGELLQERLDPDEVSMLFEEKEPSLEEVKGAFDVFDENSDGFIDLRELQRVLCALGFKEGGEVENCRRMIGLFDENGDGRIDFGEFVKLMENSFS